MLFRKLFFALRRCRKAGKEDSGITLIELMVVIVILGLLVTIIAYKMLGRTEEARRTKGMLQIRNMEAALKLFHLDNGFFPSTEQGLEALVSKPTTGRIPRKWNEGGYLEGNRVPLDPWGNPYVYVSPGSDNREYEVKSYGADGLEGGEGNDADIESWNLQ